MSEHKRPPAAAIVAVIIAVQALLMLWFAVAGPGGRAA